jgi:hypothetical protein
MSGLDAAFSAVQTIGQKVDSLNIASTISAGIGQVSSALQQAAGSLPSLNIMSKFQVKDLPKAPAIPSLQTPTQARTNKTTFGGALSFPSELKYFTKFSFYEYDKKIINEAGKDKPTKTVIFPMPNDMHETFGVDYETPSLGPIGGALANAAITALRSKDVGSAISALTPGVDTLAQAGVAGGLNMLKKSSPTAGAAAQMALGVTPNPNIAVLFSNIGLRSHSFSYKFAPTSAKELATLKTIITELKKRMLPGMSNEGTMLFSFPDVCDIEFGPTKNKPYKIKRCVMESLNVNYTPMGSPAFFKTGDPVMVEIQMSFKEMSPFTREDVQDAANKDNQSQQETGKSPTAPAFPSLPSMPKIPNIAQQAATTVASFGGGIV